MESNIRLSKFDYRMASLFDSESLSLMNAEAQSSTVYYILSEYIVANHGENAIISGLECNITIDGDKIVAYINPGSCVVNGSFLSIKSGTRLSLNIPQNYSGLFLVNIYYDYKKSIYEYSDVFMQLNLVFDNYLYPNSFVNVRKGFLPISVKILDNGDIQNYDSDILTINNHVIDITYLKKSFGGINLGDLEIDGNYRISDNKLIIDSSTRYSTLVDSVVINTGRVYLNNQINLNYKHKVSVYVVNPSGSISPPLIYPYDIDVSQNYIVIFDRSNLSIGDQLIIDYVRS